jgi:hypothetical protein
MQSGEHPFWTDWDNISIRSVIVFLLVCYQKNIVSVVFYKVEMQICLIDYLPKTFTDRISSIGVPISSMRLY